MPEIPSTTAAPIKYSVNPLQATTAKPFSVISTTSTEPTTKISNEFTTSGPSDIKTCSSCKVPTTVPPRPPTTTRAPTTTTLKSVFGVGLPEKFSAQPNPTSNPSSPNYGDGLIDARFTSNQNENPSTNVPLGSEFLNPAFNPEISSQTGSSNPLTGPSLFETNAGFSNSQTFGNDPNQQPQLEIKPLAYDNAPINPQNPNIQPQYNLPTPLNPSTPAQQFTASPNPTYNFEQIPSNPAVPNLPAPILQEMQAYFPPGQAPQQFVVPQTPYQVQNVDPSQYQNPPEHFQNPQQATYTNPDYNIQAMGQVLDGVLYKYNYTVGYHGHHEQGDQQGNKEGSYYTIGRDGYRRTVDYKATQEGFRPRIHIEYAQPQDVPQPETEKEKGLQGYEFKWFYLK